MNSSTFNLFNGHVCALGIRESGMPGVWMLDVHLDDGDVHKLAYPARLAYHFYELLNSTMTDIQFDGFDHFIEIDDSTMRCTRDKAGVICMILLPHVEGNAYDEHQTLLIKSGDDVIKYKIDNLTHLSDPKSCMLYVSQL